MRRFFRIFSIVVILWGFLSSSLWAKDLILSGSTTFQKRILEPNQKTMQKAIGIRVLIRGINSGRGFQELREGKVKASISSSPLDLLLKKAGIPPGGTFQEHVITEDVIVPIVHPSNPVTELTWSQLADIHTGKIIHWKEVNSLDQEILVVTSQPTAATRIVFQKLVMNGASYVFGVREVKTTRAEVNVVAKFKGGIGAVSKGFVDLNPGKVKIVKTEKISRPLSIITRGNPDPEVQALIGYLQTSQAKSLFK